MENLVEATVDSVRMSLTSQQRIVVLKDKNNERYLPIWIGPYESEAITIALQEIEISRPQTHDLIKKVISELGGSITRIIISELKDDIFYGIIEIFQKGKKILLDSRPSDAIAIAVRSHVPIFISEEIMKEASIIPVQEEYMSSFRGKVETSLSEPTSSAKKSEAPVDRLSVYEEYLKNLENNQKDSKEEEDDENDEDNNDDEEDDDDDDYPGNISAI